MPFAVGIVLEDRWPIAAGPLWAAAATGFALRLLALRVGGAGPGRLQLATVAVIVESGAVALLGAGALALRLHAPVPSVVASDVARPEAVRLRLTAPPAVRGSTCMLPVFVFGAAPGRASVGASGTACRALPGADLLARVELEPPRPATNPGGLDLRRARARRGVHAVGRLVGPTLPVGEPPGSPAALLERVRRAVGEALDPLEAAPVSSARSGPLLRALATGDRGRLSPEIRDAFVRSGTAHLLAVSGLHVGFVCMLVAGVARFVLRLSRSAAVLRSVEAIALGLGICAALSYAGLSGLGVPAFRAAAMALAGTLAVLGGRPAASWNALALAGTAVLALDPGALFEARLALSFAAVAGILVWRPSGSRLGALIGCTLGAALGTAPVVAAIGLPLPVGGLLANLVAVPWFGTVVVPLALLAGGLGALLPGTGAWLGPPARMAAELGIRGVAWLESPDALASTGAPLLASLALVATLFGARVVVRSHARGPSCAVGAPLLVCGLAMAAVVPWAGGPGETERELSLLFLDVGHGDAVLLRGPLGSWGIDAGPAFGSFDAGRRVVVPALRAEGITRLDRLVITHQDRDHAGGARSLVEALPVGEIWLPAATRDAAGLRDLRAAAARRSVPIRLVAAGTSERRDGAGLRVLWPPAGSGSSAGSGETGTRSANAGSLVLLLEAPGVCAMLPADIPAAVEARLAAELPPCALLKLAHHGSRTSSGRAWLARLDPDVAVASAGRRSPPLPHAAVRQRLRERSTTLWETHRFGAIRVYFSRVGLVVAPFLARPLASPSD